MRQDLFTMRTSPSERRLFDRLAEHHGLPVSGVIRMLAMGADRQLGRKAATPVTAPSDGANADAVWFRAHAAFLETGVADRLRTVAVFGRHVETVVAAVDELLAISARCGES